MSTPDEFFRWRIVEEHRQRRPTKCGELYRCAAKEAPMLISCALADWWKATGKSSLGSALTHA